MEDPRKYFDDAIIELRIKKGSSVETQQHDDNLLKIPTARHLEVHEQQPDFETLPRSKTDVSVIGAILKEQNEIQQKRKVTEAYQSTDKFSAKNFVKPNKSSYIIDSKKNNEVESIRKQSHDKIKKDIANSTAINIYKKSQAQLL